MLNLDVASKIPDPAPGRITVWIDTETSRALAAKTTLQAQPGFEDVERRRESGPVDGLYLSSSNEPLLYAPFRAAKYGPPAERVKTLAAQAWSLASERRACELVFVLDGARGADHAADVAEGLALGAYRFDKYKQKPEPEPEPPRAIIVVDNKQRLKVARAVERALQVAECVNASRDLVNEPGSVVTPAALEKAAGEIAEEAGLEIEVWDKKRLKAEGYEGLLAVGRGSDVSPRMIVLRYTPKGAKASRHLGLLGKGITFDTGGISLKPADKMWQMKGDMGGAAAVLGAIRAIARMKAKVRVTAIVVTAQNYIDDEALLPGDIIRAKNGKTIHVDNTDAEGRLVLTDGLWRMGEEGVTHLVDVATLTGAIVRALGSGMSGAFGNDRFVDQVVKTADAVGEPCWKMPLFEDYKELLKNDVADLNNIGGPKAGAITAALFLSHFVPEGVSWTHLDIAGTFLNDDPNRYLGKGATGVMVRTLTSLAEAMNK